jgi:hypothetical protein
MADKYIDIELEGEEKIHLALVQQEHRQQGVLREMIKELGDVAALTLIASVPQYNNYIMNQIGRDGPTWMPGGAGGGGEWKSIVGVKEGRSQHPIYVEFGTGIYAGGSLIFPRVKKALAFKKRGEEQGRFIVRYWVSGQRGQHYFYRTWEIVNAVARARVLARNLYD